MEKVEELKSRAKELGKESASYSRKAIEMLKSGNEDGKEMMRKANIAGRRCRVIVNEILRLEKAEIIS